MADEPITAETLKSWPTVKETQHRAAAIVGDYFALDTVWDRVRNGFIRTVAARSSWKRGVIGQARPSLEPTLLGTEKWAIYHSGKPDDFGRGEVTFIEKQPGRYGYDSDEYTYYVDIRLDPADVDREFPAKPPAAPLPPSEVVKEEPSRGPPVSDILLTEWATLFRRTYPTGSEQMAAKSASGMFQGHSVPRQKLRDALAKAGKLPPGRPAKP